MSSPQARASSGQVSALRTRLGVLTLLLLCGIQFMDVADTSIVNVALPSIQHDLHFSQQNLQWVASGYLLTYGGFLLLGGRAADLLGRRRVLVAGLIWFAVCSLAGGLAHSQGLLISARIAQGVGAAIMAPAALSILTTTFTEDKDRNTALGIWGGISAIGAAVGVSLGGLLAEGPGWRWVLFVNLPIVALSLLATFRLLPADQDKRVPRREFDLQGALLGTGGVSLLVFALIRAPLIGWGSTETILELAGAAVLLAAFTVNELRHRHPLFPFSIFRVKGLVAADVTQLVAFAGFLTMFFFVTLYMQDVLRFSPIQAGVAYLPVTAAFGISAGIATQLIGRIGTRPVIVGGALIAAAGIYWLSRVPVHGTYSGRRTARPAHDAARRRRRVRRRDHRRQRRRPRTPSRIRRRAAQRRQTSRQRTRASDLLGDRHQPHPTPTRHPHAKGRRPDLRLPTALLVSSIFVLAAAIIALRSSDTRQTATTPPIPVELATDPASH